MADTPNPLVLITGILSELGEPIASVLENDYRVVGLDKEPPDNGDGPPVIRCDLTKDISVETALEEVRDRHGGVIDSVLHLAAYYDFTGEDNPLYRSLNIEGTRRLLKGLQRFRVNQFVYSGTMLVHKAVAPGQHIDEERRLDPRWIYPKSKAEAERVIREAHGAIPYVLLHLAGLYDDDTLIPTLAHQVARIWERTLESHIYPGNLKTGQSMVHHDDMADAFRRTVDRRADLPAAATLLIGEPDPPPYGALQDRIGEILHGEHWATLRVPAVAAAAGAWVKDEAAAHLPGALGGGHEPFVRPFMALEASDHYALDITRARDLLGWAPRHRLLDDLPGILAKLKRDPKTWYEKNKLELPAKSKEPAG